MCLIGLDDCRSLSVQHRDPSLDNFLHREINRESRGVPNGFDLATFDGARHDDLAGTVPYMSNELLQKSSGSARRELWHDLEATF